MCAEFCAPDDQAEQDSDEELPQVERESTTSGRGGQNKQTAAGKIQSGTKQQQNPRSNDDDSAPKKLLDSPKNQSKHIHRGQTHIGGEGPTKDLSSSKAEWSKASSSPRKRRNQKKRREQPEPDLGSTITREKGTVRSEDQPHGKPSSPVEPNPQVTDERAEVISGQEAKNVEKLTLLLQLLPGSLIRWGSTTLDIDALKRRSEIAQGGALNTSSGASASARIHG
ncbi:unnamed protein product [Cyprideis torosa]|uniref:Uncharacterized protein n=1 Tax=Cyprideis torosa TaxID=163714 RepID=A0A7R8W627_9CRUS|nr:unnamed protein product [Cyprideis torosa]CAG0886032.1 unnamed protein product [Cyprideis torosa]